MRLEEIEKPYSKIQWLFYIIIVPTIFTLLLVGIILTFLGVNVVDSVLSTGQKVPGLSSILPEPKEPVMQESDDQAPEPSLPEAELRASESEQEIGRLENELAQKTEEVETLTEQMEQLKKDMEDERLSEEERLSNLRELAQIYVEMSTSKSAAILENLSIQESALIMNQMASKDKSAIMSKLPPTYAAKLTIAMKEMELAENPEIAALQERVNLLMNLVDNKENGDGSTISITQMVNTFTQMPPQQAATILKDMSGVSSEFQLGITILANMDDATRSTIMAAMEAETARKYTNSLIK
jgi:flagellar motility protein MotE (MotC chaperone)